MFVRTFLKQMFRISVLVNVYVRYLVVYKVTSLRVCLFVLIYRSIYE